MNEEHDSRLARLQRAAQRLGLGLSDAQGEQLLRYLELLQRWNATYNLTAVRDPGDMLRHHLIDCLAVIEPLGREAGAAGRLLDVGSGGGLPGVVIAVMCPGWEVTCVDTVGKKAAFVQQAAVELRLPRLHAKHSRVEHLEIAPVDVVASRAFSSLADFTRLTGQHLGPRGVWMAMKGKRPEEEIAALPADIDVFHVEQLQVPDLAADRCIVWMRPAGDPTKGS
jgi:16S rRNA (guanine527-N7)-methyltransferase